MASMKEIREHIASIQSTQKVTNAMYLIASTKMRRAKEDLAKTRPFFDAVSTQIKQIFQHAGEIESPYLYRGNADDLAQPVNAYSHGMKQKLVLISALIHTPKLMIMDEPFVGLDPIASHALKSIMRDICNEGGAIFFSTHVLEVAEKLCDKIAIIKEGRLITAGPTNEVRGSGSLENMFLELEGENA